MANVLPLTVSSKTTDITLGGATIEVNPFANMGITAADAPVLLSLGSKGTVDANAFAARMVKAAGQGTRAEARLFINALAAVLADVADQYGAITVQTPFGTIQTFIAGTLANPQDQPDPSVNYAFLGVVIPEAYRKLFAQIETYVPADACPAALKRVRDKATHRPGIRGAQPFYLEGRGMTIGGEGEKLELLDAVTREKICDVSADAASASKSQFLCTLAPQTAIEEGDYVIRLTTLAGGETTLWPVDLKVTLVEAVPEPEPHFDSATSEGCREGYVMPNSKVTVTGVGLRVPTADESFFVDMPEGKGRANLTDVSVSADGTTLTAHVGDWPEGAVPGDGYVVWLDAEGPTIAVCEVEVGT